MTTQQGRPGDATRAAESNSHSHLTVVAHADDEPEVFTDLGATLAELADPDSNANELEGLARTDGLPLLCHGRAHLIAGETEAGKTWLALLAVKQLIESGAEVMYLDFEDGPRGFVGRLRALGCTDQHIKQVLYLRPRGPLSTYEREEIEAVAKCAHALTVFDGVTEAMTLHGWNPLDNSDVATFYAELVRPLTCLSSSVLLLDHLVKARENRGRYAFGAQHKISGLDGAAYLLERIKPFAIGQTGMSRLTIAKDRPGRVREHAHGQSIGELWLTPAEDGPAGAVTAELRPPESGRHSGDSRISGQAAIPAAELVRGEVASVIAAAGPDGCTTRRLREAVKRNNEAVTKAIKELESGGYIQVHRSGNRSQHRMLMPYDGPAQPADPAPEG